MLDRLVVADFLKEELKEQEIELPRGMTFKKLVETFCQYTEDDYFEWLKDNYKSFFNHGIPNWKWVKWQMQKEK